MYGRVTTNKTRVRLKHRGLSGTMHIIRHGHIDIGVGQGEGTRRAGSLRRAFMVPEEFNNTPWATREGFFAHLTVLFHRCPDMSAGAIGRERGTHDLTGRFNLPSRPHGSTIA